MDKKILLGGAAALLLVGNMFATPASASIELSIGGSASVSAIFSDKCGAAAATATSKATALGVADLAALRTKTGNSNLTTETDFDLDSDDVTEGNQTIDGSLKAASKATYTDYRCLDGGNAVNEDNPDWAVAKSFDISAAGTLANGLEVSFSDSIDLENRTDKQTEFKMGLGGAFGAITLAVEGDSAVKAAMAGDTTGASVVGNGGAKAEHDVKTDGQAGFGVLYQTPGVGGMDLYLSWAPNADGIAGNSGAQYKDTFGFGLAFSAGDLTIGGGMESASSNDATCSKAAAATEVADAAQTAASLVTAIFNDSLCGDMTATAIGLDYALADMGLSAGWSQLDTDGADRTTLSAGVSTTVGEYSLSADWTQQTTEFEIGGEEDVQTVFHVGAGTSLGDGVSLKLDFSSNEVDLFSQAAGAGATNNYRVEAKLGVAF
jgi:hypothetical protein